MIFTVTVDDERFTTEMLEEVLAFGVAEVYGDVDAIRLSVDASRDD